MLTKNGFKIKSENVIIKLFVYLKYSFKKDPFLLLNRCFSKLESGFGVLKFKKSKFAFYSKFIPLYLYKNKLNSLQILYKSLKFYSKSSFKFLLDKLLNEIIEFYIENRKSFSRKLMLQRFSEISSSKKKILLSRNNSFLSSQYFNRFNRNCEFKKLNNNLFFLNSPLISSKYLLLDTGNSFFLKSIKNSFNLKLNKNIFNYRLDFSLFKYFFLLNYNTF